MQALGFVAIMFEVLMLSYFMPTKRTTASEEDHSEEEWDGFSLLGTSLNGMVLVHAEISAPSIRCVIREALN